MPVTKYDVDVSELFLCIYFDVLLVIFNIFFFSANVSYIPMPNKQKQEHIANCVFSFLNLFAWTNNNK